MKNNEPYRCPNGHVVGFMMPDGHGVKRLLFLRDSIDDTCQSSDAPVVSAIIDSGDVTCSICGKSMVWIPSVPALARLIASVQVLRKNFRAVEQGMNNASFLERG